MAIRTLGGGDQGDFLETVCNVQGTLQAGIAIGDYVILTASGNWTVNEHGDNSSITLCGEVSKLSDNSALCTVKWLAYNKIANVPTSGTITIGYFACANVSQTETFIASGNAAASVRHAIFVASGVPATNYADIMLV